MGNLKMKRKTNSEDHVRKRKKKGRKVFCLADVGGLTSSQSRNTAAQKFKYFINLQKIAPRRYRYHFPAKEYFRIPCPDRHRPGKCCSVSPCVKLRTYFESS